MQFTAETLKKVLLEIENRLKFTTDDVNDPQGLYVDCSIKVEDFINSFATNQSKEIRYCLSVLREIEYLNISNGMIKGITPKGYKCMCDVLHNINFKY